MTTNDKGVRRLAVCRYGNALVLAALAVWFFFLPGLLVLRGAADPALRGPGIPRLAWRVHRHLAPRYARWARERVASGRAAHLALHDVPSTEWPLFGSVYFLWSTEALQRAWEADPSQAPEAPARYARPAIDASLELLLDPVHHTWVRQHWGDDYLHTNNVFFRSLLIAGMTSHARLTGSTNHLARLREQVERLAADLDASPCGLLEDYPGECYPIDVFAAMTLLRDADGVLGTDHRDFVRREMRAFRGSMLDDWGLIPYASEWDTGRVYAPSRGICNSYVLIFAPEICPAEAADWYARYVRLFWQRRLLAEGFREFNPAVSGGDWTYDVDAGPVLAGFSPAANAYGVAAARANGRFDQAYPLALQVLGAAWPLANGALVGPRLLSSPVHAPYLGEANLLFLLTRQPAAGVSITPADGHRPGFFTVELVFFFGVGLLLLGAAAGAARSWRREVATRRFPRPGLQFGAWAALLAAGVLLAAATRPLPGLAALLFAQLLPRGRKGAR